VLFFSCTEISIASGGNKVIKTAGAGEKQQALFGGKTTGNYICGLPDMQTADDKRMRFTKHTKRSKKHS